MKIPSITHQGQGFLITTSQEQILQEGIGNHMQPDSPTNPYCEQAKFPLHLYPSASGYTFNFFSAMDQPILSFYYSEMYLLKFRSAFPDLINFHAQLVNNTYICDPEMTAVITKIINCHLPQEAANLLYEAKALELLTLALARVSAPEDTTMRLSKNDVEMLHTAKELLIADFENIPTIMQLARKVGTNDYKLKRGFKQLFGSSIFAYVQRVRLEKARQLLLETELSVTEIAYTIGYGQGKNFGAAFKKEYGITPGGFRRSDSKTPDIVTCIK